MVSRSSAICNAWRTLMSLSGGSSVLIANDVSDRSAIGNSCMPGTSFRSWTALAIDLIRETPVSPLMSIWPDRSAASLVASSLIMICTSLSAYGRRFPGYFSSSFQ